MICKIHFHDLFKFRLSLSRKLSKTRFRGMPLKNDKYGQMKIHQQKNKKIKAFIERSRLRNKFLQPKKDADRKAFNKQQSYCIWLINCRKNATSSNLNIRYVTDNKNLCIESENVSRNGDSPSRKEKTISDNK